MPRMIPEWIADDSPPGERAVFEALKNTAPPEWIVIHSVDLAPWGRFRRCEIDFVVVIPDTGVLCIEVKSHERIWLADDGTWEPRATIKKSPFRQAVEAKSILYQGLKKAPQIQCPIPPVGHIVVFSAAPCEFAPNLAIGAEELIDGPTFARLVEQGSVHKHLRELFRTAIQNDPTLSPLQQKLGPIRVESIVRALKPVTVRSQARLEDARSRKAELDKLLRIQQKPILKLAECNDRLLVEGGAGTGKTLVAMEVARRAAESGKRTALLCFNRAIGDWMANETGKDLGPRLVAGSIHRILASMAGIQIPPNADSEWWEIGFPESIQEAVTDPDFKESAMFDYLVLDEAQDVLARPVLSDAVFSCLRGGVSGGDYSLFGDFKAQVLNGRDRLAEAMERFRQSGNPARWTLEENCRNLRNVGEMAELFSGQSPIYPGGYMRGSGSAASLFWQTYETPQEQATQLAAIIEELRQEKVPLEDVAILSFVRDDQCSASMLPAHVACRVCRLGDTPQGRIVYSSIHAFKGLERRIVIVTDAAVQAHDSVRDLFYTALSRSTDRVRILVSADSKAEILALVGEN